MRTESRRSLLAKVHIAAKDLGLEDDAYRDMLEGLTGQRSAAKLTDRQLAFVVGSLRRKGWAGEAPSSSTKQHGTKPKPRATSSCGPLLKKIEALLADAGLPWVYAERLAKRMYQVERLEWATLEHLRGIVSALNSQARRVQRRAACEEAQMPTFGA